MCNLVETVFQDADVFDLLKGPAESGAKTSHLFLLHPDFALQILHLHDKTQKEKYCLDKNIVCRQISHIPTHLLSTHLLARPTT